jgi:hypothetical protein
MTSYQLQRLLREWLALFAILTFVLGPLAISVSRSLGAQERVAIASGLKALPLCQPGDTLDAASGAHTLSSCDQCLPGIGGPLPVVASATPEAASYAVRFARTDVGATLRAATGLPPATGPPIS